MQLFQNSVLKYYLSTLNLEAIEKAFTVYQEDFLPKIENIKKSKEEQYQYGFLEDLFVKVLGYTLNPTPNYNLTTEQKNLTDSKKADGAVLKDGKVIAVIELKSTKTKSMDKIVNQAFNYKNNHPTCKYIITSNFEKLRFYVEHSDKYEEFNLFALNEERFVLLYSLLNKESIFSDVPLTLKNDSRLEEEKISNELYKKYAGLRVNLFENIVKNNSQIDKLLLLEKTQKLLDRMVFIFFAEDRGILPTNTIQAIVDSHSSDIESRNLYLFYKIYFKAINEGNSKLNIAEYNGGLFAPDKDLDNLIIDDDVINDCPLALSAYDFNSDIDVNILGHIFENSLNDIEEMKAKIDDEDFDANKSKRKKDGVFYTPEYITKYIVDNTLGKLCEVKKEELGLNNVDIVVPKTKALNKGEKETLKALEDYRAYLLQLKILDPACGSGAFLNQALNFLLVEHEFIDEGIKTLLGGNVLGLFDVKKGILENNLYGVDINAEAVEIAKLSLWLRTVEKGRKLNSLAKKIKVGNSLIDDASVVDNAFVWEKEFAEVFEQGGFDVVIGNPPYVRQELLTSNMKEYFKNKYETHHNSADLYIPFIEKGISLLTTKGKFSFIFPNKWLKAKYGKPLREWLKVKGLDEVIDFGDLQIFQGATTYPMILTSSNDKPKEKFNFMKLETLDFGDLEDYVKTLSSTIELNKLDDNGWQLVSKDVQNILDIANNNSVSLGEYTNGRINRGILTGYNDAFIIDEQTKNDLISKDKNSINIIKPFYVGQDIQRYSTPTIDKWLLYIPWDFKLEDYSAISQYLEQFKESLSKRPEVKSNRHPWFALSRYGSKYLKDFEKKKIIYLVFQVRPAFIIDLDNTYSNNATFIFPNEDYFLLGILNSKMGWFLISNNCTEIQNGYQLIYDYFKNIPIPLDVDSEKKESFEKYVKEVVTVNQTLKSKAERFIKRLQNNFDLDKLSKKLEAFYEYDFKIFLKELKKKKVTLSLVEQDEWEEYFEAYQKELLELKSQIDATDNEIDKMVYELYGLSDEEIALVEKND